MAGQVAPSLHAELIAALAPHGLQLRGSFSVQPTDTLPPAPNGQPTTSVWMVGVVGSTFWPYFAASAFYADGLPDPLDRWSQSIGDALAQRLGGRALYPSDGPPYHPFQQWANRAEPLQPSPMLLRIHPQYGLWHAYRFALALPHTLEAVATDWQRAPTSPASTSLANTNVCATCDGQPCLGACPVGAYSSTGFDLAACSSHVHSSDGQHCMQTGCRARLACPVGPQFRYAPDHAAFHMRAFADRH